VANLPSIDPSIATRLDVKFNRRVLRLGDGYQQRAADGINNKTERYAVVWEGVSDTDADTLADFFDGVYGVVNFAWTPPRESSSKKWIVESYSRGYPHPDNDNLSAIFERVYDL
jgi:phage-related protein